MSGREERERAVELYFTTSMSTKQVVEHLGYPTATSTLTFSTDPPHVRLSPHAVHEQVRVRMPRQGGVSLWFCQSVWGCLLVAFSGAFRPVSGAVDVGPA